MCYHGEVVMTSARQAGGDRGSNPGYILSEIFPFSAAAVVYQSAALNWRV